MQSCRKAEENTKNRIIGIAIVTLLNGWLTKDLKSNSLLNNFWQISKYVWKNNEKARKDVIETVFCKIGL